MTIALFCLISLLVVLNFLCQNGSKINSPALVLERTNSGNMAQNLLFEQPVKPTSQLKQKITLSNPGFHFNVFGSVHDLPTDWEKTAPPGNLFLHTPYLTCVEENPPVGMRFSYLIFYKNGIPAGIAYCQISPFSVGDSIQTTEEKDKYPCIFRAFGQYLKNLVVGKNRNLLVCGNLLLTGEHGFYFQENISKETAFDLLEEALILVQNELEKSNLNIDGIFIKDISTEHRAPMKVLVERKFREFTFHPNMVLNIRENWRTFDDYMAVISSKYRVRAKKAFRHIEAIEKKELTENQIFSYQNRLFELYKSVAENQDFNMVSLDENYLPALKRQLGDRFRMFGYFLNGELVGYFTTIRNHDELEAHFLGFEPECNRQCQVYQNMLFDILRLGIEQGVKKVVYARTAMEIKSSVGAEPYEMLCYIRASNRLTNKILTPIIEYLRPAADWVPRNPFKN